MLIEIFLQFRPTYVSKFIRLNGLRYLQHILPNKEFLQCLLLHLRAVDFEEFIDHVYTGHDWLFGWFVICVFFGESEHKIIEIEWLFESFVVRIQNFFAEFPCAYLLYPFLELVVGDVAGFVPVDHPEDFLAVD